MKKIVLLCALFALAPLSLAEKSSEEVLDYGDFTSVTLMVKAWETLGEGKYEDTLKYTEKCASLYEEKAREMQASLKSKPYGDDINQYWALNDVGTCYFIRGEALHKLRRYEEAVAAYKVVRDELYYCQAWDPKGWHWSPSDAAYPKIEMLEERLSGDF